jgi:hypothetical protein
MERACRSARRNASTLPMSGFAAPVRTARPTIEHATSAALSRTIAPSAIKSLSSGRGKIAISKTAPFWIARFKATLSWNSISAVTSCVRANSGTSSRSAFMA